MAQRDVHSYRLHPLVAEAIRKQAEQLSRSDGWVVESMAELQLAHLLPPGFKAGQDVPDTPERVQKARK